MTRILATLTLVARLCVSPAQAQSTTSFEDLPHLIHPWDQLTVVDADGTAWHGQLVQIAADRLVIRTDGPDVTLLQHRVREVRKCCDRVRDGFLIGLGVGAALGLVASLRIAPGAGILPFGLIGGGIGAAVDLARQGEVVVYHSAQWEELRQTAPGAEMRVVRSGGKHATVLFLTADDSSLTVLNLHAVKLPRSLKSLVARIAVSDPDLLLGRSGNEFRDGDLSVRAQGVFIGDRKVADLSQVIERIDRDSVEDFSVGSSPVLRSTRWPGPGSAISAISA